jgi:hypothetical protein
MDQYVFMWDTQVISPQVNLGEQHMPWRWNFLGYVATPTHVMKEIIAYEIWHEVMWLGEEDQDETCLDGLVVSMKDKLEALKR